MFQRPELGNPLPHLFDGDLGNRKSSLKLGNIPVVLGNLPVRLSQSVSTSMSQSPRTDLSNMTPIHVCPLDTDRSISHEFTEPFQAHFG
jgi:hypothetical protein